jgi:hypothetical protein
VTNDPLVDRGHQGEEDATLRPQQLDEPCLLTSTECLLVDQVDRSNVFRSLIAQDHAYHRVNLSRIASRIAKRLVREASGMVDRPQRRR